MLTTSIRVIVGLIQEWMGCWSTHYERRTSLGMALHCSELNPLSVCRWRKGYFSHQWDTKVPLPIVWIWHSQSETLGWAEYFTPCILLIDCGVIQLFSKFHKINTATTLAIIYWKPILYQILCAWWEQPIQVLCPCVISLPLCGYK